MSPLSISAYTTTNALGWGLDASLQALQQRQSGLEPCRFDTRLQSYTGMVEGVESQPLRADLSRFECRNNRLAQIGLEQDGFAQRVLAARERYGPKRIAVVLGTSTSGIHQTELAYARRAGAEGALPEDYNFITTHNLFSAVDFVMAYLDLHGPGAMISTACSSSAKVFASAQRLLAMGLSDAVVVGGVDSLCLNTLFGFSSLELVAKQPCTPFARDRAGISIGEAAGFALLERPQHSASDLHFLGYGESSDAYHMSTPRPDGAGAASAMRNALSNAELDASAIDYVNAHGTASAVNDSMEDKAISAVFGNATACSSTKGWMGHTLGAAGITEAVVALLSLRHGFIPGTLNTGEVDPSFSSRILLDNESAPLRHVMSNSFGFGGSNCCLIFGKR